MSTETTEITEANPYWFENAAGLWAARYGTIFSLDMQIADAQNHSPQQHLRIAVLRRAKEMVRAVDPARVAADQGFRWRPFDEQLEAAKAVFAALPQVLEVHVAIAFPGKYLGWWTEDVSVVQVPGMWWKRVGDSPYEADSLASVAAEQWLAGVDGTWAVIRLTRGAGEGQIGKSTIREESVPNPY